mgnify:CR=1 FL=1
MRRIKKAASDTEAMLMIAKQLAAQTGNAGIDAISSALMPAIATKGKYFLG